jgi:uncharacterized protein (DUF2249 family)
VISADVTVARLLEEHPEALDALIGAHPHFKQLRHRLLRKVMAPRVTVAQAARIAGLAPEALVAALRRAVGEPEAADAGTGPGAAPRRDAGADEREDVLGSAEKPAALAGVPASRVVGLDVREDIARGVEPFARIMGAVKGLAADEVLVVRAPFEPIPLYDVLGRRGFAHWTERHAAADWSAWFYRAPAVPDAGGDAAGGARPTSPATATLDVRGLEPPQPMVRVLDRVSALAPGEELIVLHDRRPLFLYPQLDERGFVHETEEPAPGLVRIRIRAPAAGARAGTRA